MLNRATAVTVALAGVMILVAIMLTGTTIRMSAASRKNETEIMRLVGASNWTIRLPFVLEGVFASLIGSLLACGTLSAMVKLFITDWLSKSVQWMPLINQKTVWLLAPACGGSRRAVDRRVQHLAEEVPEGINRRSAERDVQHI